jgi:cell division protein FtsW
MAQAAPDRFGAVLCGSFAVIIVFQAFLNIGCVIGFMPITGKPLPFISAGGSSLIASLMMVGIMLSVSYASGEPAIYRRRREGIRPVGWDDYGQKKRAGARGRDATRSAYAGSGVRRWEPSLVGSAPRSRSGGRAGAGSRPHVL